METPSVDARLGELANANRALIRQAKRTDGHSPSAVLDLGVSVAALSARAAGACELNRFLDQAVVDEFAAERRSLADDLELLAGLSEASQESPDVEPLAEALLHRIEKLLDLEDRVVFQPLLRVATSSREET